ncbi:MAG: hypothetical protein OQK24_08660 [Magnetovibrio sp.]|nr:hypothetical protein [Magnetovibrio sp.]
MNIKVAAISTLIAFPLLNVSAQAEDDREALPVTAAQKTQMLGEMRGFLEAVQDIVLAMAENDMPSVIEAAKSMGMGRNRGTGQGVGRYMPMEFRQMGRGTHVAFDELAQAAEFGPEGVLEELGVLMSNCNGCHATYRLVLRP